MSNTKFEEFLSALTEGFAADEILAAGIQGQIAASISMKRQELGMNQKQLAELLGVSQGLVSKWEKGETNFTIQTLARIAVKLDLKMQSPYVLKEPPAYYVSKKDNIISMDSYRNARKLPVPTYQTYEQDEM